ncbi:MAG TPA: hypothetical protein VMJ90_03780 [Anaerolineales bacterium]|nr:hypothetical protein [Anaerolineales bacterium]
MLKTKVTASLVLVVTILISQVGTVLASPAAQEELITGTVTELICDTDTSTGITTFVVTVEDADGNKQTVRIAQLTAENLGLVTYDGEGNLDCSEEALLEVIGTEVEIDPVVVIPEEEEPQHPVGSALATFFSDFVDYDTVMDAHADGFGFGVIAQALWLTQTLEGDGDVFLAILEARQSGDYSDFVLEDGTAPKNWGQFRKAVMEGKSNLGTVMSDNGNGNGDGNANNNKDKGNKGQGGDNGNGNDNGRGGDR